MLSNSRKLIPFNESENLNREIYQVTRVLNDVNKKQENYFFQQIQEVIKRLIETRVLNSVIL